MKTDFFNQVYNIVSQIPRGKVTTYGHIAQLLGMKKSARMVGWALNKCDKSFVPAHRVVNRNGQLTGKIHFDSISQMEIKLKEEGIIVENDTVKDFKKILWNPLEQDENLC